MPMGVSVQSKLGLSDGYKYDDWHHQIQIDMASYSISKYLFQKKNSEENTFQLKNTLSSKLKKSMCWNKYHETWIKLEMSTPPTP